MEEKINFKQELDSLEEILQKMNSSATTLDECIALFEKANEKIKTLQKALEDAKEKVEKVIDTSENGK